MEELMWVRLLEPVIDRESQEYWMEGQLLQLPVSFAIKLVNMGKAVEYHVPGGQVQADMEMSDTSINPVQNKAIKQYVDGLTGWEVVEASLDNVEVPANSRKLVEIPVFEAGDRREIQAYRMIFLQNASIDGVGRDRVVIQSFSTAGQRRTAQISLANLAPEFARVSIQIAVLARKTPLA